MRDCRSRLGLFVLVGWLAACSSSSEPTDDLPSVLQNDSFAPGDAIAFQGGLMAGEAAAAFFPAQTSAYTVQDVQFLFGGDVDVQAVTLVLYAVTGAVPTRTPIFTSDYDLTPSDAGFQVIELAGAGVEVAAGEGLQVAIFVQHDGLPGPATDDDGRTAGRNLVFTGGSWQTGETAGLSGDWIIRAGIE